MMGTVAVTDIGWYSHLRSHPELEEVNFWKPSAARAFTAVEFSPFLFKLKAPHNAICGYAWFARYSALPDWLAWQTFGLGNGCDSLGEMRDRIRRIRDRIRFAGPPHAEIGCVLLVQPVFFGEADWVEQPRDWRARTVSDKAYDLSVGEGARVWSECLARTVTHQVPGQVMTRGVGPRYGQPVLVRPRLGQRTFQVAVMDAYGRACAVTGEHSLPALEAAHIRAYAAEGPHEVRNGLLLRADLHRLFDGGYLGLTDDLRLKVSPRLREEFRNGRSYYPLNGSRLSLPRDRRLHPDPEFVRWHREKVYAT